MTGSVSARLSAAGLQLPESSPAVGAYLPVVRSGSLVYTSGQLPWRAGELLAQGVVGDDVTPESAAACAEQCALNALSAAASICDLDSVVRVVKLVGYIASAPGFGGQPGVIDGASSVMAVAFGESGKHAREAVGVVALPLGAPVEISLVLEVR